MAGDGSIQGEELNRKGRVEQDCIQHGFDFISDMARTGFLKVVSLADNLSFAKIFVTASSPHFFQISLLKIHVCFQDLGRCSASCS